jgi:hypothetical protein
VLGHPGRLCAGPRRPAAGAIRHSRGPRILEINLSDSVRRAPWCTRSASPVGRAPSRPADCDERIVTQCGDARTWSRRKSQRSGLKRRPRDYESDQPRFRRAALGAGFDAQTHVAQGFAQGFCCGPFLAVSAVFSPQVSPEVSPQVALHGRCADAPGHRQRPVRHPRLSGDEGGPHRPRRRLRQHEPLGRPVLMAAPEDEGARPGRPIGSRISEARLGWT